MVDRQRGARFDEEECQGDERTIGPRSPALAPTTTCSGPPATGAVSRPLPSSGPTARFHSVSLPLSTLERRRRARGISRVRPIRALRRFLADARNDMGTRPYHHVIPSAQRARGIPKMFPRNSSLGQEGTPGTGKDPSPGSQVAREVLSRLTTCGGSRDREASPKGANGSVSLHGRGYRACGLMRGRWMMIGAPWLGVFSASIVPPCASTIDRAIARPSPEPPSSRRRALSLR